MTDKEFLSQNLDILYQNTPLSTLAKDWIFFTNSSEFGDLAFVLFIILLPLSFCFLALSFLLEEQDENRSIKSRTKIPINFFKLYLAGYLHLSPPLSLLVLASSLLLMPPFLLVI